MPTRRAVLATAGSLPVAGCAFRSGDDDDVTPTTGTPTVRSQTDRSPTETLVYVDVEYVVRAGPIPDDFASLTTTVQPVFVEDAGDLGPCYPEVYLGPYAPTITPIRTPAGECRRGDAVDLDLATMEGLTIETTAPATAEGHALLATAVVGTDEDGEEITAIKGTGGVRLIEDESPPSGAYGVEVGVEAAEPDADYDYVVTTARFEPE